MPLLWFGPFHHCDGSTQDTETDSTVADRFSAYKNEAELGYAITEASVDRSKLFVTTKVWEPTGQAGDIERALKESLKKLQVEYVDL
jgi:diketogulonate reductase-like aldo/keto reductase